MTFDLLDSELLITRPDYGRFEDYFGLWAMHQPQFAGLYELAARMDFPAHIQARQDEMRADVVDEKKAAKALGIEFQADSGLQVTSGGIALIPLRGSLMKAESSWSESTSTVATRQKVRAAKNSPDVTGALFVFDTPGGTVSGTAALAEDIAALEAVKPTSAFCEDLCASAGYWLASQTGRIATNATGLVGSIGTFMAIRDTSGLAEDMKIKVHVIRAGALKGAGTPGTAITDEMLASWQQMVNQLNDQFLSAVSAGRKMSMDDLKAIADGSVYVGAEAKSKGLVDAVESMDETIRQLMERAGGSGKRSNSKGTKMAAATYEELEANLIGADADFLVSQMKAKNDLPTATKAWMTEQNNRTKAANEKAAKAAEDAEAAAKLKPKSGGGIGGGKPKAEDEEAESEYDDAIGEFEAAVAKAMEANGGDKDKAVVSVARKNPTLHVAYKQATNPDFADQIGRHAKKLGVRVG